MDAIVTVAAARNISPGTVAIKFETSDGSEVEPDQFVKLSAEVNGESYAQFYTFSSSGAGDTFEVTVGIDPEEAGSFSQHLGSLIAGDDVEVSGPFGQSYYNGESRVVIFAGDPGIGPAVSIAKAAAADGNEAAVVYLDDVPTREERLSALRDDGTGVVVTGDESDLADAVADAFTGDEGEQLLVYSFADFVSCATDAVEAASGDADAARVENSG